MLQIIEVHRRRCETNPGLTPEGHWVGLAFKNDHGRHVLELNGRQPLPEHDTELRSELEYLLWDYGLLCQQDAQSSEERALIAQDQWDNDRRNYLKARRYMEELGSSAMDRA